MKKFWLCFGLALMLACWSGGIGYYGLGTSPALAQYPYPPPPDYEVCYQYPYSYCDYYYAPYADPYSQFFYYTVPEIGEEYEEHEWREHREHEPFERREHERGRFEHERR